MRVGSCKGDGIVEEEGMRWWGWAVVMGARGCVRDGEGCGRVVGGLSGGWAVLWVERWGWRRVDERACVCWKV